MTEIPPPTPQGFVVTVLDVWKEVTKLNTTVTQALSVMTSMQERNKNADGLHADYEKRLRALEKFQYKLIGAVIAAQVGLGALEYFLLNHK